MPWVFFVPEKGSDWVSLQDTSYVVDTGSCVPEVAVFMVVREAELVFVVSHTHTSAEGTVLVVEAEDLVADVTTVWGGSRCKVVSMTIIYYTYTLI